ERAPGGVAARPRHRDRPRPRTHPRARPGARWGLRDAPGSHGYGYAHFRAAGVFSGRPPDRERTHRADPDQPRRRARPGPQPRRTLTMTGLCTQCGTVLRADGVSEWRCSPDCLVARPRMGFGPCPTPARRWWRTGQPPAEEPVAAPGTARRAARAPAAVDGADGYLL